MTILRVIDFETNGFAPPDEVLELGWCDLIREGDGPWEVGETESLLFGATSPLKPEVRAVHHISPAEIAGKDPYTVDCITARAVTDGVSALVAHNWSFEGQWVPDEHLGDLRTICTYKAALRVWPDAPSHSNNALRYWLEDNGVIELEHDRTQPVHRAGPDAYVTAHLLRALLEKTTGREMVAWTREPPLLPRCPIGKFRGKPWAEVETGFLKWMLGQDSMEKDLKWNAGRELDRRQSARTA